MVWVDGLEYGYCCPGPVLILSLVVGEIRYASGDLLMERVGVVSGYSVNVFDGACM